MSKLQTIEYTQTFISAGKHESVTITAACSGSVEQDQLTFKEMKEHANSLLKKQPDTHPYDSEKPGN